MNKKKEAGVRFGKKPNIEDTRGNDKLEIDYFHLYQSLYRKELNDWLAAREQMHNPFNQITYPMQQMYRDAMLDNHLQGAIENRILRVLNKEFILKDSEGAIDKDRSSILQTRWFRHIVRKALESKFYGYSLIYLSEKILSTKSVIDLPRENVIPQKNRLVKNAYDPGSNYIDFSDFPNYLIYIQLAPEPFGILERIAPLTVLKRHSWANWDEFEQIFGMPIRIAKTMINTQKHKDDLQNWLETMGTASYGIFDKSTDIEIKESSRTDAYKVYYEKIQAINKEISKGIVGQTMTMDDGSSQSQANVHLQIYDEITSADIMDIQDWATDDLFPILRVHGLDIPDGYYLSIAEKENIKPADKIKIDQVLMTAGFNPDPSYVEDFYGFPLDKTEPKSPPAAQKLKAPDGLENFFV